MFCVVVEGHRVGLFENEWDLGKSDAFAVCIQRTVEGAIVDNDNESKGCQLSFSCAYHPCIPGEEPAPGSGFCQQLGT